MPVRPSRSLWGSAIAAWSTGQTAEPPRSRDGDLPAFNILHRLVLAVGTHQVFKDALAAAVEVLADGLGAREGRVLHVPPGGGLQGGIAALALAERRPWIGIASPDGEGAAAVPILLRGVPVAVIELRGLHDETDRTPLAALLETAGLHLALAAECDTARSSAARIRQAERTLRESEAGLRKFAETLHSKIEAGRLELAQIDFPLRGVVEDTVGLLAPRAHEKGMELSFREGPDLPAVVSGDPLRLRQAILLPSVSSPDDVRTAHQAGFDSFVSKPVSKAESTQPILGVSAMLSEQDRLTPRLNGHILVVEDNVANQEVIGQMLRTLGCRVQLSSGALAGLRAMCEQRFDLVLMDIQMPGMDGVEALNRFRRGTAGRFSFVTPTDTPVIAVTANALGGDEAHFLGLGFNDYLSKPFRQGQLLAMLSRHLRPLPPMEPRDEGAAGGGVPARDAPTSSGGSDVLDEQALQRLRELDPTGENRLMERVVNAFESSVARLMPQLIESQAAHEMPGIRHVAHTLKSSSASIGAVKLSKMCSEIETMARQDQSDGMASRIELLQQEVEVVRMALKKMLQA